MTIGLAACDKPKDQVPLNWKPESVSLNCPSGECPSGTGMLLFLRREKRAMRIVHCTATMISENTILTNDHCDLTKQPATKGYFFTRDGERTVFAQITGEYFKTKGRFSGLDRDLAVLQLAKDMPLQPRKIARKIPVQMNSLVGFVANRQSFGHYSLDKITCNTKDKMAFYGGGVAENHTGLALFDCSVIPGNSGAALFTPDNYNDIQVVVNTVWKFYSGMGEASQVSSLFLEEPEYLRSGYAMGERVHCQEIKGQASPEIKCPAVDFERTLGDPFRAAITQELQKRITRAQVNTDIIWTTEVFSVQMRTEQKGHTVPAVILAPKAYCLRSRKGVAQDLKFTYLKIGLIKDGTARTRLIAEDRMQVMVTGSSHGNVELMFSVTPVAKNSDFAFRPKDRIRFTDLASPASVNRIPACDSKSADEAAVITLNNVNAIKIADPAKF